MGRGVGPLLISNKPVRHGQPGGEQGMLNVEGNVIAIPGEHTTAHLLFSLAYPAATKKLFMRYDEIEQFVLDGKGLGVIIHENRFTYKDKGLHKIADLGDYWEKETGQPIPLGAIVVKNEIITDIQIKIDGLIKQSIEFAFSTYPALTDYIKVHAQEMSEAVMLKHIDLYVNDFSIGLGEQGRNAVKKLMEVYHTVNHTRAPAVDVFV